VEPTEAATGSEEAAMDKPEKPPDRLDEQPAVQCNAARVQDPGEPAELKEPGGPAEPKEPGGPAELKEPEKPGEPAELKEPEKPGGPAKLKELGGPAELKEPEKPGEPAELKEPGDDDANAIKGYKATLLFYTSFIVGPSYRGLQRVASFRPYTSYASRRHRAS
jgi:hypothetical protein